MTKILKYKETGFFFVLILITCYTFTGAEGKHQEISNL